MQCTECPSAFSLNSLPTNKANDNYLYRLNYVYQITQINKNYTMAKISKQPKRENASFSDHQSC